MNKKGNIRKWLTMGLWSVAVLAVAIGLLAAMRSRDNQLCAGAQVTIKSRGENAFVNEAAILDLLEAKTWIQKKAVKEIDTRKLEAQLKRNPWIETAELFFDKKQVLQIKVTEREPLLRVIAKNNQSFYLDAHGSQLPFTTQYTARVPVFTGFAARSQWNGDDSILVNQMVALAGYIQNDAFWQAQVQQIDIVKDQSFELVPTLGNHRILFGDTSRMAGKFDRLHRFYKKIVAAVGFDRYSILNVQFAGQIVAIKRGEEAMSIDTAKASATINHFLENNRNAVTDETVNGNTGLVTPVADTVHSRTTPAPPAGASTTPVRNTSVRAGNATPAPKPVTPVRIATPARNTGHVRAGASTAPVRTQSPKPATPKPPPKPTVQRQPRAVMPSASRGNNNRQ
jgi:cell division protein FtsQ